MSNAGIRSQKQEKTDGLAHHTNELNFKRKGFIALLGRIHGGGVRQVAILHKDRLCPFRPSLIEWVLEKAGTKFVVHGDDIPSRKGGFAIILRAGSLYGLFPNCRQQRCAVRLLQ